jgi:hypothetical protein
MPAPDQTPAEPVVTTHTDPVHDSLEKQDYHDYMDAVAEIAGYDDITFTGDLPAYVGGVTIPDVSFSLFNGTAITGSSIEINDRYLDAPASHDNFMEYIGTLNHELGHGLQFEDIAEADEAYTSKEMEHLLFAHEGQTAYTADGKAYQDGQEFYDEFYERVLDETDDYEDMREQAGDVLHEMSEENIMAVVGLEMEDGGEAYELLFMDRDRAEAMSDNELYDAIDSQFDADLDLEASYEVDFRDSDIDTYKLGEHLVNVHEDLEDHYSQLDELGYQLPQGAQDNLDMAPADDSTGDEGSYNTAEDVLTH